MQMRKSQMLSCRFNFYKTFACVLGTLQWLLVTIALAANYWFQSTQLPDKTKIYGGFFKGCTYNGEEEKCAPLDEQMKTDQWSTATHLVLFSDLLLVAACVSGCVSCACVRSRVLAVVATTLFGFATLLSIVGYLQASSQISDWGVKPAWGENDLYVYKLKQGWCAYVCAGSVVFGIFAQFLMALGAWKDTATPTEHAYDTDDEEEVMDEVEIYQTGVPLIYQN